MFCLAREKANSHQRREQKAFDVLLSHCPKPPYPLLVQIAKSHAPSLTHAPPIAEPHQSLLRTNHQIRSLMLGGQVIVPAMPSLVMSFHLIFRLALEGLEGAVGGAADVAFVDCWHFGWWDLVLGAWVLGWRLVTGPIRGSRCRVAVCGSW